MSRQQYNDKADRMLSRLVSQSSHMTDDDIIIKLTHAIETLGRDYASIK